MDKVSARDPEDLEPATTLEGMAPKNMKSLPPTTPLSFAASERQDSRSTGKAQKTRKGRVGLFGKHGLRVWLCKIHLYVAKSSIAGITLASSRFMGLHCIAVNLVLLFVADKQNSRLRYGHFGMLLLL